MGRRLTDGEREIVAELERDAAPTAAEWATWGDHCPSCGAPDDAPGGCRCWVTRVEAHAGPADEDDLPF